MNKSILYPIIVIATLFVAFCAFREFQIMADSKEAGLHAAESVTEKYSDLNGFRYDHDMIDRGEYDAGRFHVENSIGEFDEKRDDIRMYRMLSYVSPIVVICIGGAIIFIYRRKEQQ